MPRTACRQPTWTMMGPQTYPQKMWINFATLLPARCETLPIVKNRILRVAVPSPLHRYFDYLPPVGAACPTIGARVRVPFGRQRLVGLVADIVTHPSVSVDRLRPIINTLDSEPVVPRSLLALARWAAAYYHYPPGEALVGLLPKNLRAGRAIPDCRAYLWRLTDAGARATPPPSASRQRQLLNVLLASPHGARQHALEACGSHWRGVMRTLIAKGWAERIVQPPPSAAVPSLAQGPVHTPAQSAAIARIQAAAGQFGVFLLDGVTGSGKTEVFLTIVKDVLAAGRQALVMVPEIALSPQLITHFEQRLAYPVQSYHSALPAGERHRVWLAARDGNAGLIIGTRSAIFLPLANPGLIVCDEEHDTSYKQQDGFRYSARDLAVVRASRLGIPLILGSATPSLESLYNVQSGRYTHLRLPERANATPHPPVRIVDLRGQPVNGGLSAALVTAMRRHIDADGQVLLFLNRRGFAPVLRCDDCGVVEECRRCDARMTLHQRRARLICHHCGAERPVPDHCTHCGSPGIVALGRGTERLERVLQETFPATGIARIDRDSTRGKGAIDRLLGAVRSGVAQILIGTQMVTKGHDFPNLTLVGVISADQGLYGVDFHSTERMAQLIVQVAGRAGRASKPGEVIIQTHSPEHPIYTELVHHDYARFAQTALAEREAANLPPISFMALLRAEAVDAAAAQRFLTRARDIINAVSADTTSEAASSLVVLGPASAPMLRRQGRYRFQLLLQANQRPVLHHTLTAAIPVLEGLKEARRVRWSIDVDPVDLY